MALPPEAHDRTIWWRGDMPGGQKCAMSPNPGAVYNNPLARSLFLPHRDHGSGAKFQSPNLASSVSRQQFVRSLFIARSNPPSVFECDKSEYEAACSISSRSSEFRVYVKTIRPSSHPRQVREISFGNEWKAGYHHLVMNLESMIEKKTPSTLSWELSTVEAWEDVSSKNPRDQYLRVYSRIKIALKYWHMRISAQFRVEAQRLGFMWQYNPSLHHIPREFEILVFETVDILWSEV